MAKLARFWPPTAHVALEALEPGSTYPGLVTYLSGAHRAEIGGLFAATRIGLLLDLRMGDTGGPWRLMNGELLSRFGSGTQRPGSEEMP